MKIPSRTTATWLADLARMLAFYAAAQGGGRGLQN